MKWYCTLALIFAVSVCKSQVKADYTFLNEEMKPVKEKKAVYVLRQQTFPNQSVQVDLYNYSGSLIKSETFSDKSKSVKQGRFSWYDRRGRIDSTGYFKGNERDKSWYYFNDQDSANLIKTVDYENGKVVKVTDPRLEKNTDTTGFVESEFPGAMQGWMRYLNKTLRYPDRAVEMEIQGQVRVFFMVNKNGGVEEPILVKSVEMSLDEEAVRVISTPAWVPATKNGEKVNTYKVQPLSFKLVTR